MDLDIIKYAAILTVAEKMQDIIGFEDLAEQFPESTQKRMKEILSDANMIVEIYHKPYWVDEGKYIWIWNKDTVHYEDD